jgi:hypothetical protein
MTKFLEVLQLHVTYNALNTSTETNGALLVAYEERERLRYMGRANIMVCSLTSFCGNDATSYVRYPEHSHHTGTAGVGFRIWMGDLQAKRQVRLRTVTVFANLLPHNRAMAEPHSECLLEPRLTGQQQSCMKLRFPSERMRSSFAS